MGKRAVPHPRLVRATGRSAAVVLVLGVAALLWKGGAAPDVVLDRPPAHSAATQPQREPSPASLPAGTTVDLPWHDLEHLPDVLLAGTLRGDRDEGCAWIEMDGSPKAVRWASGMRAHFPDPGHDGASFQLLDRHGQVVAAGGAVIYFSGALSGAAERLERCHVGADEVWYVGQVTDDAPF